MDIRMNSGKDKGARRINGHCPQPVVGKKIVEVKPCFHSVLQLPGHKRSVVVLDVTD
jgi:hypothetical protein